MSFDGIDATSVGATPVGRARGLWQAMALSIAFLIVSALQSAHSFYGRIAGSSMTAATRAAWTGQAARDVAWFVTAQIVLHLAFGLLAWLLANATILLFPRTSSKFSRVLLIWFLALAIAVITFNAVQYPWTGLGEYYHGALTTSVGPFEVGRTLYLVIGTAAGLTLLLALARDISRNGIVRRRAPLGVGAAVLVVALITTLAVHGASKPAAAQERPNVILIGIDSLRLDQLKRFGGGRVLTHVDDFLQEADIVRDVTTPVARTFSSWSAILSGRDPLTTGARFNLADRQSVKVNPTLGDVLRKKGYRAVYSTDEVRFANIDESYGFDQVITPPIGAIDFIIGNYNELPLATVVANSTLGKWLFPYTYANRGAATMYQPQTYLRHLDRELSFDGPTFFIVHLTASHWPYFIYDTPYAASQKKSPDDRPTYRVGVEVADSMFGDIVAMLKRKGAFENAIVIVLSDHGEALELPQDTMIDEGTRIPGLRAPIPVDDFGHGQSVLSPVQFQVLLGFRTFGKGAGFQADGRDLAGGATVEDIAPTLLQLLRVPVDPLAATGQSLAPALLAQRDGARVAASDRVRYTETDLRVLPRTDGGGIDEAATAEHNARFLQVDPKSGRMHVSTVFAPLVVAMKQRAAFTENYLLAALPAGPFAHQYVLVDKHARTARLLLDRPGSDTPEPQHLWDEMWRHYASELQRPVSITREDWPIIDAQWEKFFVMREAHNKQQQAENN